MRTVLVCFKSGVIFDHEWTSTDSDITKKKEGNHFDIKFIEQ